MKFFELIFDYPGPSSMDGTNERSVEALNVADKTVKETLCRNFIEFIDSYRWTDKTLYKIIRSELSIDEIKQLMDRSFSNRNQPSWRTCGKGQYVDANTASLQVKFVNEVVDPNEVIKYSTDRLSINEKFRAKYEKFEASDIFVN